MSERRFRQVDVFTDRAGYGNALAVVIDGQGLSDEQMARFARWMNLSETTFLLPPTDAVADYRVRIFTPTVELPFAGHPTLGSNTVLSSGVLSFPNTFNSGCLVDDEAGVILVSASHDLKAYSLTTGVLQWTLTGVLPAPAGNTTIHWVAPGRVFLVSTSNTGTVALVDYYQRETLWRSSVGAVPGGSAFNSAHNILATLDFTRQVNLWALEFVPATLSAPAFVPVQAHVHRVMGYNVRVRLTGDASEDCPDYWVEWSLLGEPPKGQLEKTYLANQEGYLQLRLSYDHYFTTGSNWDNNAYRLTLGALYPVTSRLKVRGFVDLAFQPYDNRWVGNNFAAVNPKRNDTILILGVESTYNLWKGLELNGHYFFIRDNSNIALYDYDRHIIGMQLAYRY